MSLSGAQRVYDRLPIFAQNLAVSVYGLHLERQRYGGGSRAFLEELLSHESWDGVRIRELQLDLLRARAVLALERVPAYETLRGRLDEVRRAGSPERILEVFPILTKEEVRRSPKSYVPTGVSGSLLLGSTGGTTGKPLVLYRTLEGIRRNFAFFSRMRRWRGLSHRSRTATFMGRLTVPEGTNRPPYWRHAFLTHNLLFSSYHISPGTLPDYIRALADFAPEEVVCYPSSGAPVAMAMVKAGLSLKGCRAVFTTAETLSPAQREAMEQGFGCPVADQYGAGEWTVVVSQCEHGTYHLHPDYGYLEVLDEQGRPAGSAPGRAVATGFINDAMVLMRYDTGDIVRSEDRSCACGRAFPVLAGIEGRSEDSIRTPDGRTVGRLNNFVFAETTGVAEGQLVQTALDRLAVRVVPGSEWTPAAAQVIQRALTSRLGPAMKIDIELVTSIPRTKSGKFISVIGLDRSMRGGTS